MQQVDTYAYEGAKSENDSTQKNRNQEHRDTSELEMGKTTGVHKLQ